MGTFATTYLANNASDFAGAINNVAGYTRGTTSINVDGLTAAAITYHAGMTLVITGDPNTYKVQADNTSSVGGAITALSIWPPLARDVADNVVVTFSVPQVNVRDRQTAVFSATGINGTFTPEGTVDGVNWFGVGITPLTSTTIATTFTAAGVWRMDTRGLSAVRIRVTTPGTATTSTFYWTAF